MCNWRTTTNLSTFFILVSKKEGKCNIHSLLMHMLKLTTNLYNPVVFDFPWQITVWVKRLQFMNSSVTGWQSLSAESLPFSFRCQWTSRREDELAKKVMPLGLVFFIPMASSWTKHLSWSLEAQQITWNYIRRVMCQRKSCWILKWRRLASIYVSCH